MPTYHPRLISSVYGEITSILLVYPGLSTEQGDEEYADIENVFKEKGDVYRFRKEVHNFQLAMANFRDRSRGEEQRFREIFALEPSMDIVSVLKSWSREMDKVRRKGTMTFQRWAQDPFLVLEWDQLTLLLNSLHNQRMCDFFLPLEVAQQVGPSFLVQPTRWYLEGGNVLCSEEVAFVGKDLVRINVDEFELSESEILAQLKTTFGVKEILMLGLKEETICLEVDGGDRGITCQPLFHIDVFMNLAGRNASGQEIIFWGSPGKCKEVLESSNESGITDSEIEERAVPVFQEVREQLSWPKFEIVDIPIFFCNGMVFSWNNCLVEVTKERKQVYLPSYQTKADHEQLNPTFRVLEEYIEGLYDDYGFEVHWFRHGRFFRTMAEHGGSLHCIVKVMKRNI